MTSANIPCPPRLARDPPRGRSVPNNKEASMRNYRLNERQLSLLKRIAEGGQPVTSKEPALATTVYALRNRWLVTTSRSAGVWTAAITDAGLYYLEHGHHPRKDQVQDEPSPSHLGIWPRRSGPALPEGLVERLMAGGGHLRIPNPDPDTRAAWRRAIHSANQSPSLPKGKMIRHQGRDSGDI